ncbi:Uncharacterized protein SAPIO_CDS4115 [Scedosporium apiospermum]|uniref:Transcription factor domain-containing protein n=1 Tax=Pseudallescheria apiosperma TaxID=563466 RepID=A0A084G9B5_PSEDA|nr:Uncharacterized protein SAPIO_CDS4115 [Scedosporium apiospermum]KEZ43927.1 Uncharacterized protein SAPIO_CDS4115 [Scedosporium apiospermum]
MDHLLQQLLPVAASLRQTTPPSQASTPGSCHVVEGPWITGSSNTSHNTEHQRPWLFDPAASPRITTHLVLDDATLHEAIRLYFKWCHNQPISLFTEDKFLETLKSRDHELLLAMQALSLRFPPNTLTPSKQERLDAMSRLSRQRTMDCLVNRRVKLSTLQSLCLLSMVDMAALTIRSLFPDPFGQMGIRCKLGAGLIGWQTLAAITGRSSFWTLTTNPTVPLDGGTSCLNSRSDMGILKYTSQLSEVWHMARIYAASHVGPDTPPPWSPQSDYSAVTQRHLEVDCSVPLRYRFAANKFGDQTPESLQKHRHYWGPWLFLQFIYAAIPCLLNHPFLLSMRLRNFRHTMPQFFIHQSFDLITRHAGWITYFIDLLDKKSFQPSDPSLAHCVVIVATIHLQHSFVEEPSLREKAQAGFDKCLKFLRLMGSTWPRVSVMADNLDNLRSSVVVAPSTTPTRAGNENSTGLRQAPSINAQLLWDMLIYERAGQRDAAADQSMFHDSLAQIPAAIQDNNQDTTTAEFDLVGSAGISGHKTVPKDSPAYPPDDAATPLDHASSGPGTAPEATAGVADAERYVDGIGAESNYEGLYFQADDFSRAIDDWMSINLG